MSDCLEVLFVGDDTGVIQCLDPRIGTTFINYRGSTGLEHNCLSSIAGNYLIAADKTKPLLHVWPLNSQETLPGPKLVIPGRASAVCCSPDGLHCVVAIDAKLYIYNTSSGALLGVISKHYRGVTKLLFLSDSAHFVSCGENGGILVWRLATTVGQRCSTIVDNSAFDEPVYSFSHHALRITDAYVSPASMRGRLYTASIDQTVKMYDLRNGDLLLSISFDDSITALRPNCIETMLYVGTTKGEVVLFNMDPLPRTLDYNTSDIDIPAKFKGHGKTITAMDISLDGYLLVTAGADCKIIVWDISARQQLRAFDMKGPVTNVTFSSAFSKIFEESFFPDIVFRSFQRVSTDDGSYSVNANMAQTLQPIRYESFDDDEIIIQQGSNTAEVECLKSSLSEAVHKNQELYKFAMEKILKNPYAFENNPVRKKARALQ